MYGQNKFDNKLDADYDNKYNFKLYGIPQFAGANTTAKTMDGTEADQFMALYGSGVSIHGSYIGANTTDYIIGHAEGSNMTITKTNNIGVQWTVGPFLAGGLEGYDIFTVGSSPAFYFKVHMKLSDVSGTDDCHVGFRLQSDANEVTGVAYTDFASLNVDGGTIKYENNINNAGAASANSEGTWADNEWAWLEVRVSGTGVTSYYKNGVELTTNKPTVTFDTGDIITPWFFQRQDADTCDIIIDEIEFGLQ